MPEFSYTPLNRAATAPLRARPTSSVARRLSYDPPWSVSSPSGLQPASFTTRLITPPPPPRPKIMALEPFRASTRSTLYKSRRDWASSRAPTRFPPDPGDHTSTTTAAEDHGVGTFQGFDTLDVVQITEVLGIVADTIDEEISSRRITSDRGLIPISFALSHRHAGNVACNIGHVLHRLILDQGAADHGYRLGNIA